MYLPEEILYEVLGTKPKIGFEPANEDFICPFIDRKCTKRSTQDKKEPYPVCSIITPKYGPICVCPERFRQHDFLGDVMNLAWPGVDHSELSIANEVTMKGFGRVDHVISKVSQSSIEKFVSVELQAIDFTGSVRPVYDAMRMGAGVEKRPSSGPNWKNVSKRYMNQLISKGFYHHHWGSKIYATIQDKVYDYFRKDANFLTSNDIEDPQINIIFLIYSLTDESNGNSRGSIRLSETVGTHHSNLQNAVLYKATPDRRHFESAILTSLSK